jgi:hypothetical protein
MKSTTSKETATMKQNPILESFVSTQQASCIRSMMRGEEGKWFKDKIQELQAMVDSMPVTYETETQTAPAVARLHYFKGSTDAWIVELDKGSPDDTPADYQRQAWGAVDLGYGPEMGYVSIPELLQAGLELDLHWTPRPIDQIVK